MSDVRRAMCQCGQLSIICRGDAGRISVCHCLECQRRSGSAFAAQARFPTSGCTVSGVAKTWSRSGDDGGRATFSFCPDCGSTVFYRADDMPETTAVALGAFTDGPPLIPFVSVYEGRKRDWVMIIGDQVDHQS